MILTLSTLLCRTLITERIIFYCVIDSDIDVAKSQMPKDISLLVNEIGLLPTEVELFGRKKAKITLDTLSRLSDRKDGRYVVVTG